jgi:hypothetical protein
VWFDEKVAAWLLLYTKRGKEDGRKQAMRCGTHCMTAILPELQQIGRGLSKSASSED